MDTQEQCAYRKCAIVQLTMLLVLLATITGCHQVRRQDVVSTPLPTASPVPLPPIVAPDIVREYFVVVDCAGKPYYMKVLRRRDGLITSYSDVLLATNETMRYGDFREPMEQFPDPPTAEAALEIARDILLQYENITVAPPFYCSDGGLETWLIPVKRDGLTIAEIRVGRGQAWEYNPPPPPPPPTPTPRP